MLSCRKQYSPNCVLNVCIEVEGATLAQLLSISCEHFYLLRVQRPAIVKAIRFIKSCILITGLVFFKIGQKES
jgi:hypothetical protein